MFQCISAIRFVSKKKRLGISVAVCPTSKQVKKSIRKIFSYCSEPHAKSASKCKLDMRTKFIGACLNNAFRLYTNKFMKLSYNTKIFFALQFAGKTLSVCLS